MPATASITDDALERGRPPADAVEDAPSRSGRVRRWLSGVPPVLVVALLAVFAVVHVAGYPGRLSDDPLFNSPHENVRYELAERWLEDGRPAYPLPLFDRLPADIAPALTPRDAALLDGEVVPKDFAYALALTTGLRALTPWLPALTTTVSAVALLLVTGLLGRAVLGSRAGGLLAAVLLVATVPFWSAAAGLVETGAVTASLLVGAVVVLLRRRRRAMATSGTWSGVGLDALAGVLLGVAVGTHYATVLLAGGIALAFAWRRDGGSSARLAALVGAAAVALVPVLAFNAWVYGSALTDGYRVGVAFLDESLGEHTGGLFPLRPGLLVDHLRTYVLRWEVLVLLALAAAGFRSAHAGGGRSALSVLGRACLLGGIPFLVFSGARPLSGVDSFLVNASLMRYLAPVAAMLAVAAAAGVLALGRSRPLVAGAVAGAAVVGGLAVVAGAAQGPVAHRDQLPRATAQRALALEIVPPDAVVVTGRADKVLWPARATLTAPYLVDEAPEDGDTTHLARRSPTPARLAEVVAAVTAEGIEVFVWNDGRWFNRERLGEFPELDERLAAEGIERVGTAIPNLYGFETG